MWEGDNLLKYDVVKKKKKNLAHLCFNFENFEGPFLVKLIYSRAQNLVILTNSLRKIH